MLCKSHGMDLLPHESFLVAVSQEFVLATSLQRRALFSLLLLLLLQEVH
jgi:hypothetical protein